MTAVLATVVASPERTAIIELKEIQVASAEWHDRDLRRSRGELRSSGTRMGGFEASMQWSTRTSQRPYSPCC